jgi:hypothetical protein
MAQQSWFHEHPWMTYFLAGSLITGIVHIVRPPKEERRLPPLWSPPDGRGGYPSGYEVHAYEPRRGQLDMPSPFVSLEEARAYVEPLIQRGFKVAIRYVPPGYAPGDPRSVSAPIQFAQPADYNPWSSSKSPREA